MTAPKVVSKGAPPPAAAASTGAVLFVSDAPGDTFRYRCEHQAEQLGHLGVRADVAVREDADLEAAVRRYAAFVLHRVAYDDEVARFLSAARAAGRPVLFDADDLVFDPSGAAPLASVAAAHGLPVEHAVASTAGCRATLRRVDAATLSTDPLRERALPLNPRALATFNAVSDEMVALADHAVASGSDREADTITLAYLSGTPTHQRDWAEAADAVLAILHGVASARLLVVGYLELDDRFGELGERVERLPFLPWRELPRILSRVDVNLAPLERGNAFSECKSALKYLEAALVGVPTVASACPDFVRAIDHGRTGFLARGPADWQPILEELVHSAALRRRIGDAAREETLANHTTRARAPLLRQTWTELLDRSIDGRLVVAWLAPDGEARLARTFRLAQALATRGHVCRLYAEPASLDEAHAAAAAAPAVELRTLEGGPLPADLVVGSEIPAAAYALELGAPFAAYVLDEAEVAAAERDPTIGAMILPLRHLCTSPDLAPRATAVAGVPPGVLSGLPGTNEEAASLETFVLETCFVRPRQGAA